MLMNCEKSVLLIVDVQERLAPAIDDGEAIVRNCAWLAGIAGRMKVPVVVTEHFPGKIGSSVVEVKAAAVEAGAQFVTKEHFSAEADGCLKGTAIDDRRQVVVCGTEAHVCVQQTALGLRWAGHDVFVVADAAGSRRSTDRELAFARMRGHGIEIVSREMVAFEWLRRGGTELFREVNRDFIR